VASFLSTPARREFEKLALDVVACGGVGLGEIERGESVVNVVVERDRGLKRRWLGGHGGSVVAKK